MAATWMARLLADDVSEQDRINCQHWRELDPQHEQAWQRMCQVSGKFSTLPSVVGRADILEKAHRAVESRRRFLNLLGVVGVGVTATWLGMPYTHLGRSLMAEYRTGVGETQSWVLEDGTQLILNTDSAVDVLFSSQERFITLHHGEIRISTGAETPRRHFVVNTRYGELVALGTVFNVRQYKHQIHVAVLEGVVEVRSVQGGRSQQVAAGQQALLDDDNLHMPEPLLAEEINWHQGRLVVEGMRVADFVAEITRYHRGFILYDSAVADLTISGVFSLQDTDRALKSMANSLPVVLNYRTPYWVKILPAD